MSVCLDFAEFLGAWQDKEGILHWPLDPRLPLSRTDDVRPLWCRLCGEPEHGSAGCKRKR